MPSVTTYQNETAALVVAAGQGARAGGDIPKQYRLIGGQAVLAQAVASLRRHPAIGRIHVVVAEGEEPRARTALGDAVATIGAGGSSRQESVRRGLAQIESMGAPARILVHDAARPFIPRAMIDRILAALDEASGACPALAVVDSLRRGGLTITAEVSRENLWRVQTPQGFRFADLSAAHALASPGATDDAEVLRAAGHEVRLVPGDERAMKVTLPQDFDAAERLMQWATLSGSGYDVHRFGPGDHVWLCGVAVPHDQGLVGHSDADVGLHALTDALLGSLGEGDIGVHFPPVEAKWRGASSDRFLTHAAGLVRQAGGRILHCDITLICEAPKIGPHRPAMLARLGEILADHAPRLSVKATTTEGLGFTGRREGIAAQAIATIRLPMWS
ncbi:MAG: bifunctional 2-C-methyl-D-erythritol 4-phosphate cytidylyltransferase/2-C-methyl-D-erythritol 2,4-cyclodiphosphate synthase [Sandarakinorhabdus sp.]|nr:bifunctional 2-C-methyl-D-erythritol 4-phosphate cytidylyltransferase/2-C-methyl-D-erythritol 2,4-cyclodiphosphate synthase [Sandarakinorhabdus sp.]